MNYQFRFALIPILLGLLACRPVWTVGWTEILILGAILFLLLGPSLWRFSRRYRNFKKYEKEKRK